MAPGALRTRGAFLALVVLVLGACRSEPRAPRVETTRSSPIGGHDIDLSCWKLTLPVDAGGGFDGVAAEVKKLQGVERRPWFEAGDGALVFTAPVKGATTKGSKYPRCELRELRADGSLAAWTVREGGSLRATLSVDELPRTSRGEPGAIVIGQIHGPDDELCRLYFRDGKLTYSNDRSGEDARERSFALRSAKGEETAIPLGAKFDYSIEVGGGSLRVSATHGANTYSATERIGAFWEGEPLYFKAGVYVQVKDGSGRGRVTLRALATGRT